MMKDKSYENASGIPMDPGMKIMYQKIFKVNPDECLPITGDMSRLEIKVDNKKISFEDFLNPRIRVVSLDNFSTQKLNEEAIKQSGMPEQVAENYKRFFVNIYRIWGLIEHEKKSVGIACRLKAWNGFPHLITNLEEFMNSNDPDKSYRELLLKLGPQDAQIPPKMYQVIRYAALKGFLKEHPVTEMGTIKYFFINQFFKKKK